MDEHKMTKRLLIFALLAFGVACQKAPADSGSARQSKPPQATQAGEPNAAPANVKPVPEKLPSTIARVNGEAIGKEEFERAVKDLETRFGQSVPQERRSEIYRELLDQMIASKLLLQQSKALKVNIAEADVDARIRQLQGQFPDEQAFTKALGERHITLQQLKDDQRKQLLIARVLDSEVGSKLNVQPKDVEDFYAKNPDRFKQPENVRVQHILIRTQPDADAAAKAKAKTEAESLLRQIKAGADFGKVAREKSQDPTTAQNGGELPAFTHGQMVPPFEEAAFKLKPGQMSPVVETQYGFHVIKMIERHPGRTVPLDEVRQQISEYLKQEQGNQKTAALIGQLKAKSKIEVFI